ncbi:MAG: hypothetical protein IJ514_01215 [Clostridia bacterium]|nr:hypothetical protein [Clostridia bacterium]
MEYSQVILEMLERIKVLENKVKALEEKNETTQIIEPLQNNKAQLEKVSAKYRKLTEFLLSSGKMRICLTYPQIEEILGFSLPDTAKKYKQSYWANTATHSYASSWMAVGYKARVDVDNETVTFEKNLY